MRTEFLLLITQHGSGTSKKLKIPEIFFRCSFTTGIFESISWIWPKTSNLYDTKREISKEVTQ